MRIFEVDEQVDSLENISEPFETHEALKMSVPTGSVLLRSKISTVAVVTCTHSDFHCEPSVETGREGKEWCNRFNFFVK